MYSIKVHVSTETKVHEQAVMVESDYSDQAVCSLMQLQTDHLAVCYCTDTTYMCAAAMFADVSLD